jgi:hypothetical protein
MALRTIHIGAIENAFQWDDTSTPFYSDGSTPVGLIVPVVPSVNNAVVRKVDLGASGVDPLADEQFVVMAFTGDLANERKLAAGVGVTLTDGGAGGNATLAVKQQSAVASLTDNSGGTPNDTVQALSDPADLPSTADALRDDLVANLIPELRNNIADLTSKINTILDKLRSSEIIAT